MELLTSNSERLALPLPLSDPSLLSSGRALPSSSQKPWPCVCRLTRESPDFGDPAAHSHNLLDYSVLTYTRR